MSARVATQFKKLGAVCLTLVVLTGAFGQALGQSYTLSVVPQFPQLVLYESWQPLLSYLSERTGVTFELVLEPNIPAFEASFLAGEPDFAFMNPYHEVMAKQAQGYIPLVSDGSRQLRGILVVRQDSPYRSVQDLQGQTLAFPAPNAFGASLYMRALLTEEEKLTFDSLYVETHSNAYRFVMLGQAAASGGVKSTLSKEPEELQAGLRILYETPGVTPHPISVHPRVPEALREAFVAALLELATSAEGQAMLEAVQLSEPIPVTYAEHYQQLEQLHLEDFVILGEN
ncbi:MAG: phosphate/phosphite/phosphonate ABC transporter substrate-binding protein [Trueperaceae bacterium]|nr:phosphate/phosphite/phosphonate ABC transporter substrate-binding protein [Trueperaceae bacterium]